MEAAKQQFLEQTHQTILKVGFESNDYKIVADLTSPKFVAFGTALDEKIFGLKDLKALLKHQKEQAKGIDIKLNVNNLYTHISEDENTAVYIDEVILAITNDGESIDMLLRLSVVLEYIEDKWMMVHFHSSKPEHVESDKDTWGIETWKAKAEQLEKEVAERTADLVLKNKDLEIESALERVRSASMAMQKTEDISEVVTILFDQLNHLNVPFLQIWITILNLDKDYIDIWMSPAEGVYETSQHFTMPSLYFEDTAIRTWRSKAPFSYRSLKSDAEVDEFINACDAMTESTYFSHGRKIQNYKNLEFIEARHEYGFISKSNTEPPTETEANILQRFAKVFEQAYTRFLDIEKAEAQTREAQIDTALERIRARSMAMKSSDELSDVLAVLFRQYDSLGIKPINAWLSLFDLENNTFTYRATGTSGKRIQKHQVIDLDAMDIWQEGLEQWKSGKPEEVIVTFYPPEIMPKLMDVFSEVFAAMPESERINPDTFPDGGYNVQGYCKFGYIGYNHTSKPTDEEKDIVRKFAKEFGRLYQRFLDIEKAEAQAREAQIEAALEKVRSRSLAMQSSDELQEVVHLVAEKMQELGVVVDPVGVIICTYPEGTKDVIHWTYTEDNERTKPYYIPYFKHPIWDETYASFNSEDPYFSKTYEKKDKHSFLKRIYTDPNSDYSELPQEFKDWQLSLPLYNLSFGWGSNSAVLIPNNDGIAPNESQKDIIIRFAKVFDQCYIRFLDLKKSEAQAREAEIQLALERVRASSLAMKSSEDLTEVLTVLFSQFNVLGIQPSFAHLTLFDEKNNRFSVRMTGKQGQRVLAEQYIDVDAIQSWKESYKKWQKGRPGDIDCIYYPPEVLEQVLEVLKELNDALPKKSKLYAKDFPNGSYTIQANFEYGYIGFNDDKMATDEQQTIVKRFAKEFSSAYRRFLDIEKAEKQAREAKIEVALERIRAKSMAMHTTEELNDVISVMFSQIEFLDIDAKCAHLTLMDLENNSFSFRITGKNGASNIGEQIIDLDAMPTWNDTVEKWKKAKQHSHQCLVYPKEVLPDLFKIIGPSLKTLPAKERIRIKDFPSGLYDCEGHTKFGYIGFNNSRPPTDEEIKIVIRFAREFERVYQRFLDLQKAEAQAREAQIQLSLERVRAKAMSMRQSEELTEVLPIIFEQLDSLGVKTVWTHLTLLDLEKSKFTYRMTGREGKRVFAEQVVDFDASDVWQNAVDAFKAEEPDSIVTFYFPPETLPGIWDIFDGIFSTLSEGYKIHPEDFPEGIYTTQANCEFGYIGINNTEKATEEEENILARFAKEFGSLYRRFLDLQKAEAQVRESQIETALEKVRSTSMAMHKSAEMQEVANAVYEQMESLGLEIHVIGMSGEIQPDSPYEVWVGGSTFTKPLQIPYTDSTEIQRQYNKAIAERPELYQGTFSGDVKKEYIDFLISETDIPKPLKKLMQESSAKTTSISFSQNSSIQIVRYTEVPYSEEDNSILVRFAKVFNQAYIRFLDLQKAEYQAREAQIEASLERVRAKAMAMHQTDELTDVLGILFDQFEILGVNPALTHLTLFDEANDTFSLRITTSGKKRAIAEQIIDVDAIEAWRTSYENWKKSELHALDLIDYKAEDLPLLWEVLNEVMSALPDENKIYPEDFPNGLYTTQGHCKFGYLGLNSERKATEEEKDIVVKFAKEFGRLYQRFLDLQKAEAQAKEAQIEAALEKVRSRTMAMQTSSELPEAANTLFLEVQGLGIPAWSAGYCIWNEDKSLANCNMSSEGEIQKGFMLPTIGEGYDFETPLKKGEKFHVATLGGKELVKHYDFMKTLPGVGDILSELINSGLELPTFQIFHICYFNHGYVMFITYEPVPNAHDIFKRFSAVFEQTYTRFLDLERAEAQTREAQIEMALEKVRSRTMAMQKGEELKEVVVLLYKELIKLGVTNFVTCGYVEINEATQRQLTWVTNPGGDSLGLFYLPLTGDATFDERYEAWKNQQEVFHQTVAGKVRQKHLEYAITTFNSKEAEEMVLSQFPDPTVFYCFNFPQGYLHIVSGSRLDPEEENVLARFTRVFEQTYTRFLDLERAEAQAKESQIEMALEKVRSRTMAMQHSDELQEASQVLFNEVQNLGIPSWSCGYNILSDDKKSAECWMSSEGSLQEPFTLTYEKDKYFIEQYNFFKSNKELLVQEQKGKDLQESYEYMKTIPKIGEIIADLEESGISLPTHQFNHLCKFNKGYLLFITYEPVPDAHELFLRFTKVFEQTYTRFLDLKKAEAQAREAQIEAALERVRSQSMGMQSTSDFGAVTTEMFTQLRNFGEELFATGIVFCDKHEGHVEQWHSIPGAGMVSPFIVPIDLDYIHQYRYDQWKKGEELFSIEIPSDFINQHFKDIFDLPSAQIALKDLESRNAPMPEAPPYEIDYGASFEHGYVLISSLKPLKNTDILIRFTNVFEQAYTRFLDLKKAEKRAREAQIEMALEKVRSRTMAMQSSEELAETSVIVFKQLLELGIAPNRLFIGIINDEADAIEAWATNEDGSKIERHFTLHASENNAINKMVKGWKTQLKSTIIDLKGKELQDYFHYLNNVMKIPFIHGLKQKRRIQTIAYFSGGLIGMAAPEEQPQETLQLLERFASVFNLTYTRFKDLKKAEAQARESQIEAALEKIRSRSLAMQSPDELQEVVALVAEKLKELGVIFDAGGVILCTYFPDNKDVVHWIAVDDFSTSGRYLVPYFDNPIYSEAWDSKIRGDTYFSKEFPVEAKNHFFKHAFEHSDYKHMPEDYKEFVLKSEQHRLSAAWSKNSAILIPSLTGAVPSESDAEIMKRFANVFEHAYIRFMDLQEKEIQAKALFDEKQRLEKTLSDLQTTQKQLIQSEKMASLGELTAGIAHEIQNPLNFVNNFSEVSKELLEEMQEEIENGDFDEVKAIMADVIQNLEKINHHGQRADGIVKGMLQHSRASGDKKEPTDINKLADEYMRLAYHGLRAKNKQFNATLETDFDQSLPKTPIIPQDIGRVILNLFTNAFFAVEEKKTSSNDDGYEPTVSVSTKQKKDSIEITVKDNANGIPEHIKDKIFQPFFTTKPTGQGTGLGLSMSYDIITKGHGGELKVETKQNEGTSFIIKLPTK